jgi:hypothetical protein
VQVHDDQQSGDLKKGATDHACDATRYLLIEREPLAEIPQGLRPQLPHHKRVTAFTKRMVLQALKRVNEEAIESQEDALDAELPPGVEDPELEGVASDTTTDFEALWQ